MEELARLSGELEDRLGEVLYPGNRFPRPEAVLELDVNDHVVRLAHRAPDNMSHVSNALARIRNQSHKRRADADTGTVVALHAIDDSWSRANASRCWFGTYLARS